MHASVDVIIPAHNAAGTIAGTLRSLASERRVIRQIFVISDSSTDETAEIADVVGREVGLPLLVSEVNCRDAGLSRNAALESLRENGPTLSTLTIIMFREGCEHSFNWRKNSRTPRCWQAHICGYLTIATGL